MTARLLQSGAPSDLCPLTRPGKRSWRSGIATFSATPGRRTDPRFATHGSWSLARHRPHRKPSPTCGSSVQGEQGDEFQNGRNPQSQYPYNIVVDYASVQECLTDLLQTRNTRIRAATVRERLPAGGSVHTNLLFIVPTLSTT